MNSSYGNKVENKPKKSKSEMYRIAVLTELYAHDFVENDDNPNLCGRCGSDVRNELHTRNILEEEE